MVFLWLKLSFDTNVSLLKIKDVILPPNFEISKRKLNSIYENQIGKEK